MTQNKIEIVVRPGRAAQLVAEVVAVSSAVALSVHGDAVSGRALELVLGANVVSAVDLIGAVATVVVMIAAPPVEGKSSQGLVNG